MKDPEVSQEHRGDIIASVTPGQVIQQSFISRRPRLNGIELWMQLGPDAVDKEGLLWLEINHDHSETPALVSQPISFKQIADSSTIKIEFKPLDDPPNQSYIITLRSDDGTVHIMGRAEDIYTPGTLFINGEAVDADLSFRSSYQYNYQALWVDLVALLGKPWLALFLLLALWLPGALLLDILAPEREIDFGARVALSIALSLAIVPVLMLWTSLLGISLSRTAILSIFTVLSVIYLWRILRGGRLFKSWQNFDKIDLTLIAIFLISLVVRMAMVRDLAAPAWVDSVHHGMLTRLILEHGRFPETYSPYIDLPHANYHIGFHNALAVFQWLSGMKLHTGMLLYGQVLNALSIFSAYLFTSSFTRSRLAGLFAAFFTGLFSPMPAYYAGWGRYTQLAGLIILPAASTLLIRLWPEIKSPSTGTIPQDIRIRWASLAVIACAGLALTHYRVAAFLAILVIAHWLTYNTHALLSGKIGHTIGSSFFWIAVVSFSAFLLTLPWWSTTISGLVAPMSSALRSSTNRPELFTGFAWNLLTAAYGRQVIIMAGLGLALSILMKRWFWPTMILWVAGMFILANTAALGIPYLNFVNNLSVEITLYLPLCLFGGYLISWPLEFLSMRISERYFRPIIITVALIGFVTALFAARALLPILNPVTFLFRAPDEPAIAWIEDNLPEDERVMINPFLWGYGLYAGADGGYWISPLAGRATLPPPVLYGMANDPISLDALISNTVKVLDLSNDPEGLHTHLKGLGINYLFLGARGGILSPRLLQESPLFETLYNEKGVWIYELR